LEDFTNETLAKQKVTPKKMNATQQRGLNIVKQRIRKNNKDYQAQIDVFRADNDAFMESDEEEELPLPKPTKVRFQPDLTEDGALDDDEGFATVGRGGRTLQFTPESIFKHLRSILESRGKKNTDRLEQIKIMEKLNEVAVTPYQQIRVLLTLVSARFDLGSGGAASMPLDQWKAAEKELGLLLKVLENNTEYIVIENAEEWDDDDKPPTLAEGEKYIKIPGSVVSYVERLDDELIRSLQSIDPHTSEYIERLTDEGALYNIIFRGLLYYEMLRKDASLEISQDSVNRIIARRLEHVYFKVCAIVPDCAGGQGLLTQICSPLKWSRYSRRTVGSPFPTMSTHPSPHATSPRMLTTLSTSFPRTYSPIARALFVLVLCCSRFTSWPCMTSTTGRVI
jgi:translation initiation factor 3 subunit C